MGLCTLANVKLALFPTGFTDTTDDATLTLYIDAVSREIQEYTGRQFETDAAPVAYKFDVPGTTPTRSLYIQQGVQSFTFFGFATVSQPQSAGSYTAVTASNILLRPQLQDRRPGFPADTLVVSDLDLTTRFYPGYNTISVTGTFGFAAVPPDIERIALAIIVRRWQARKGGQTDTIGPPDFGGDVLRFTSPEERAVLNRYRHVTVG